MLTADRNFYSWSAWDAASATGAALLWRAPTQLDLPVVRVLVDGTYLTVLVKPTIRGARREQILAAARVGADLTKIEAALDERGCPLAHLARVVEYDVPDRVGNGSGELIVLLSTITDPGDARADELAGAYHQRWEEETGNDQLKTHLRGPGTVLRSRLPDLVHQEIWAYLIVHHAISALIAKASAAADLDPDRISFTKTLRLIRRTATGTADIPPQDWTEHLPQHLAAIATLLIPTRRERTSPRALKRARHNNYRVKKPNEPASTRHNGPATIRLHSITPRAA